jgi:hypothetical protein
MPGGRGAMTDREKLEKLISEIQYMGGLESRLAEHLLANGVTFSAAVPGHENNYDISEMSYNNGYAKGCDDSKPKWIPVSERLPEDNKKVLVLLVSKIEVIAILRNNVWLVSWNHVTLNRVTHWMPLPEPPKENGYE